MAFLVIPTTPSVPRQRSKLTIEGRPYILELAWNQREARWYLSLFDELSTPLVVGMKLVFRARTALDLFQSHRWDPRVPRGALFLIDRLETNEPPGLGELGDGLRCQLIYRESTT